MTSATHTSLVLVSAHTLPGKELVIEGREGIEKHMNRVLRGGIADVEIDWLGAGDGFIAWRDHGTFWGSTPFSESHTAAVDGEGHIAEHVIHSVYQLPS